MKPNHISEILRAAAATVDAAISTGHSPYITPENASHNLLQKARELTQLAMDCMTPYSTPTEEEHA